MTLPTLLSDISFRKDFSNISNSHNSLNFDKTGSTPYDPVGFKLEETNWRWNSYIDTSGFRVFYKGINNLSALCKSNGIAFFLVYLPVRSDKLTGNDRKENQAVADTMKNHFGNSFIDLHNVELPVSEYYDAFHLFKDGSEVITNLFLDSLKKSGKFDLKREKAL